MHTYLARTRKWRAWGAGPPRPREPAHPGRAGRTTPTGPARPGRYPGRHPRRATYVCAPNTCGRFLAFFGDKEEDIRTYIPQTCFLDCAHD